MIRDRLDDAIDQVAARLVAGPGDHAALARRIVEALPDRSPRWRWLVPQLAAAGAMAVAAAIWTARPDPAAPVLPSSSIVMPVGLAASVSAHAPRVDRVAAVEIETANLPIPMAFERAADFDRALAGLSVDQVSTRAITAPGPIALAPIEITTIATPDEIDPRRQES